MVVLPTPPFPEVTTTTTPSLPLLLSPPPPPPPAEAVDSRLQPLALLLRRAGWSCVRMGWDDGGGGFRHVFPEGGERLGGVVAGGHRTPCKTEQEVFNLL